MKTTILVAVVALAGLIGAGWLVYLQWVELGVELSMLGWGAYALGAVASLTLAGGLFYMLFYSARSGFDDIDRPDGR